MSVSTSKRVFFNLPPMPESEEVKTSLLGSIDHLKIAVANVWDGVSDLLEEEASIMSISNTEDRYSRLSKVLQEYVKRKDIESIERIYSNVVGRRAKELIGGSIAVSFAQEGDFFQSEKFLISLSPAQKDRNFAKISILCAEKHDGVNALKFLNLMGDNSLFKESIKKNLLGVFLQEDRPENAMRIARGISDPQVRGDVCFEICRKFYPFLIEDLGLLERMMNQIKQESRETLYSPICKELAKKGDIFNAKRLALFKEEKSRGTLYVDICNIYANYLIESNQTDIATIEEIKSLSQDPLEKDLITKSISKVFADQNDTSNAKKWADLIIDLKTMIYALQRICKSLIRQGKYDEFESLFNSIVFIGCVSDTEGLSKFINTGLEKQDSYLSTCLELANQCNGSALDELLILVDDISPIRRAFSEEALCKIFIEQKKFNLLKKFIPLISIDPILAQFICLEFIRAEEKLPSEVLERLFLSISKLKGVKAGNQLQEKLRSQMKVFKEIAIAFAESGDLINARIAANFIADFDVWTQVKDQYLL